MVDQPPADQPPTGRPSVDQPPGRQLPADELAGELRAVGRTLRLPAPPDGDALASAVGERLEGVPSPASRRGRPRAWITAWPARIRTALGAPRRAVAVALAAVLLALVLTPPVRATVAEWFGFGVVVRPGLPVPSAPAPPAATGSLTLAEAERLVRFAPVVPPALGTPDSAEVGANGRLLSLSWNEPGGTRRLDEFEGRLAPRFVKSVGSRGVRYVDVDGQLALWFPEPHEVELIGEDSVVRTESARPAGPTLVWESAGVTLRLEGVPDRRQAIEIAESIP
jgi:hypothetical protein